MSARRALSRRVERRGVWVAFGLAIAALALHGCRSPKEQAFLAAQTGDCRRLRNLLAHDQHLANVRRMPVDFLQSETAGLGGGEAPLHLAARDGHLECIQALLNAGADPNAPDLDGETPLFYAARGDQTAAVRRLLAAGTDPQRRNRRGLSALVLAAQSGAFGPAKALLPHDRTSLPRLCSAAMTDDGRALRLELTRKTTNVNKRSDGFAALHYAALAGAARAAETLIEAGASPGLQTTDGRTAVFLAAQGAHHDTLAILLHASRNPKPILAKRDAARGATALHAANTAACGPCVSQLLSAGADVNAQDSAGASPLHEAALSGCGQCARALIAAGADVNAKARDGRTPLHEVSVVANVGYGPRRGQPFASAAGQAAVARALLLAGANPLLRDDRGFTASDFARRQGREDIVAVLVAYREIERNEGGR